MKNLNEQIAPAARTFKPYAVADATGFIKLDAMENPYPLPDTVAREIKEIMAVEINRYPDSSSQGLRTSIKEVWPIPTGYDVVFGNGSDELIALQVQALGGVGSVVMSFEPSFVVYKMQAEIQERTYVGVDLNEDYSIDLDRTLKAIEAHQPTLIFIAYPNNPTGNLFNRQTIEAIIQATPGIVVLDEAYCAFSSDTWLERITQYPNAVVMRTLSKSGLAGIRLGVLIAPNEYCDLIDRVRMPYNINVLTQEVGQIALRNQQSFDIQTEFIKDDRARQYKALTELDKVVPYPSEANFILIKIDPRFDAVEIAAKLKEDKILVKCFSGAHPLLLNTIRVTIGTEGQNQRFLKTLHKALAS